MALARLASSVIGLVPFPISEYVFTCGASRRSHVLLHCSLVRLPRRVAIAFHGSPAYGLLLALNGSARAVLLAAAPPPSFVRSASSTNSTSFRSSSAVHGA